MILSRFVALSVSLIQKVSLLQVPFLGDPRYAYVVAAASVVACVAHLALNFKETLDVDKRKPMVWKDANPFGFLSFLFKSVAMFRLMLISAMQTCIDSRNVFEVKPIASARLGLCRSRRWRCPDEHDLPAQHPADDGGAERHLCLPRRLEDPLWRRDRQDHHQNLWVRAAGSSLAGSVKSKRELTLRLGGMTTFSNVANAVAQGLGAVASSANYMYLPRQRFLLTLSPFDPQTFFRYVHVLATGFGERKRDAVETMITKLGAGNGSLCKSFFGQENDFIPVRRGVRPRQRLPLCRADQLSIPPEPLRSFPLGDHLPARHSTRHPAGNVLGEGHR